MDERYVRKRPSHPEIKKDGVPGYATVKGWTLHAPAAAGDESNCRRLITQVRSLITFSVFLFGVPCLL
jgi:hypothetical protein